MRSVTVDRAEYDAVQELHRLYKEAPDVVTELVAFLRLRPHTATVSLRFHGGKLQCAELVQVVRQEPEGKKPAPA